MFLRCLLAISIALSLRANASLPLEASLSDLACAADHFLVGRVVGVDMIDDKGRLVRDDKSMTGPGLRNTIRLHVEVVEVIDSSSDNVPPLLNVPLDPLMHYSLGQIRAAYGKPSEPALVFLRGESYSPVIAGRFFWSLGSREEAVVLRKRCRHQ